MDVGARTAKEVTRVSHGMAKTELRLFTGSAHPLLAQEIAEFLCVPIRLSAPFHIAKRAKQFCLVKPN